jgi:hypothetical protein
MLTKTVLEPLGQRCLTFKLDEVQEVTSVFVTFLCAVAVLVQLTVWVRL